MTPERIAHLRFRLVAQSTGPGTTEADERNELCDLAEEAIRLREFVAFVYERSDENYAADIHKRAGELRAALAKAGR